MENKKELNFEHFAKYTLEENFPKKSYTFKEILNNTPEKNERENLEFQFNLEFKNLINFRKME